ncbi:MAG: NUDIX domain-containing protein [Candidatus Levybacteria bacterium]|nr:NUDIX domain-containing protein [Candidatus Levybacteria bacterium]
MSEKLHIFNPESPKPIERDVKQDKLLISGQFATGDVTVHTTGQEFQPTDTLQAKIDKDWAPNAAKGAFPGPLVRLDSFGLDQDGKLNLTFGTTNFKDYVGSRDFPSLAENGYDGIANPISTSAVVLTSDGKLLVGVKQMGDTIGAIDGIGGYLHPERDINPETGEIDPFFAAAREIREETGIKEDELQDGTLLGLSYEIAGLCHPVLSFLYRTDLSSEEIMTRKGDDEINVIAVEPFTDKTQVERQQEAKATGVASTYIMDVLRQFAPQRQPGEEPNEHSQVEPDGRLTMALARKTLQYKQPDAKFAGFAKQVLRTKEQLVGEKTPIERATVLNSKDISDGEIITRDIELGDKRIYIEAMKRIGGPNKSANEDAFVTITDGPLLQVLLVDGGSQIAPVPSLEAKDLKGGKFIAEEVERYGQVLNPRTSVRGNLYKLNSLVGQDIAKDHPDIAYTDESVNVPYGSIAGIKIDSENNTVEVANAGDVYVVTVDTSGNATLLTVDDVHKKDQQTFAAAREVATKTSKTVREVMEGYNTDPEMQSVLDEEYVCAQQANTGEIRRITGAPNFETTSSCMIPTDSIAQIFVFSDGAIPAGTNLQTQEGVQQFANILTTSGIEGLETAIQDSASADPDFQTYPRFRDIDDFSIVLVTL